MGRSSSPVRQEGTPPGSWRPSLLGGLVVAQTEFNRRVLGSRGQACDLDGALNLLALEAQLPGGVVETAFGASEFRPNLGRNSLHMVHPDAGQLRPFLRRQILPV